MYPVIAAGNVVIVVIVSTAIRGLIAVIIVAFGYVVGFLLLLLSMMS